MKKTLHNEGEEILRKHSEETVRLLYSIIEEAPDGIQIVDLEGHILYSNAAVKNIYGFSPQELKGRYVAEMNADPNFAGNVILPGIKKNGRWQGELLVKHKEGYEFPVLLTTSAVCDNSGKPIALMGIIKDITERKKTEQMLRQDYEIQCVINSLLNMSIEDMTLGEFFEYALELIISTPGLLLEPKGCIFLVEGSPEVLVMKAQKGLSQDMQKRCLEVFSDECVCVKAAKSKKVEFISGVPVGYYCIPILSNDTVLGVINLYVKEGYAYSKKNEFFLNAIAYTLAGVIKRKNMDGALRNARYELESVVAERTAELVEANKLLIEDMLERKDIEKRIRTSNAILNLLSKKSSRKEYIDSMVKLIRGLSSCHCVGIRLLNEKGQIPYESYIGFSKEFWESESWLSVKSDECACVRVIRGRPLPQDAGVMTASGSFLCGDTARFFERLSGVEKNKFRTACVCHGFKSVAIIPIRYKDKIIGAIHLADQREAKVEPKIVESVESLTLLIGEGIHKFDLSEQILHAQRELHDAKRLSDIGALSATIAHELRNPLAAIGMAAYNIKRKSQNPLLDKHLNSIEKKINESNQIIDNLLFYAHIKMPQRDIVNIHEILNECSELARVKSSQKNISITEKMSFRKDIAIEADPLQMKELFTNILNNAFDSFEQARGRIEINGEVVDLEFIKISIKDNGIGIDAADLDSVFEPFFTTKAKGVGLGLSVCYQIIQLHAGTIDIKSIKDKGTIVTVTLPIRAKEVQSSVPAF